MTARRQRGAALLVGGLLSLLFALIAAVQVGAWTTGAIERTTHQVIKGPVGTLKVEAGAGDILVVPTSGHDVRIDSTAKGALHTPRLRAVKDGLMVRMTGNCPAISFGPCRASIVLHVPAGTRIDVRSGSGDLTASGIRGIVRMETGSGDVSATALTGDADLRTSSGDVNVRALGGDVTLRTASGDVTAEDLAAGTVQAVTSSGDVALDFRLAPRDVDAATASGDVHVSLPVGEAYRVEADTGSGDSQVGVKVDRASKRIVRARTSSGDATVDYGN
jgi:DUF4097 and DUF4098 domain-containing protein YvlB